MNISFNFISKSNFNKTHHLSIFFFQIQDIDSFCFLFTQVFEIERNVYLSLIASLIVALYIYQPCN